MASQIAEVRMKPFVILAITDAQRESLLSESKLQEITKTLEDMSLQLAQKDFSLVYIQEIELACKCVLGITNLGLLIESENNIEKAKILLSQKNIMDFFRIGWTKIMNLEKVNPEPYKKVYLNFSLEANNSFNSLQLFERIVKEYGNINKLKQLNKQLVSVYYGKFYENEIDQECEVPSHRICSIITKIFIGTTQSKGPLNKTELLQFVEFMFRYSKEELIKKIRTDRNIIEVGKSLPIEIQSEFFEIVDMFLDAQNYPIDEIYRIKQANPDYNVKVIACLISGSNNLDIQECVMPDIASELSDIQRKNLNLGDDPMILE